jgi:plasmid stability protein
MGDIEHSGAVEVRLMDLQSGTHEALEESAERNGRSVHEEAEHIIRTHLAENENGQA